MDPRALLPLVVSAAVVGTLTGLLGRALKPYRADDDEEFYMTNDELAKQRKARQCCDHVCVAVCPLCKR